MDVQRMAYTLDKMCAVLAVSESGYRAWKHGGTPDRTRLTDAQMLALTRASHTELKGAYGDQRTDDGVVPTETGRGAAASLGSGQPVRQPTLPGQADGLWHGGLHESQGKLLG